MAALTADRPTPYREGVDNVYPVVASTTIYAGALVALDGAGNAKPASKATRLKFVGVAQAGAKNGTTAGEVSVLVRRGVFGFKKATTLTKVDIGSDAYALDDQTVTDVSAGACQGGQNHQRRR